MSGSAADYGSGYVSVRGPLPQTSGYSPSSHSIQKKSRTRIGAHPPFRKRRAANETIAELSFKHGISVLDINPLLSVGGIRRPEMTTDGIHLSALACRNWIEAEWCFRAIDQQTCLRS